MNDLNPSTQLMDVAMRIRDMRDILGYSVQKMAELTELTAGRAGFSVEELFFDGVPIDFTADGSN